MRSTGRPRRPGRSSGEAGSSGVRSADRRRAALPAGERARRRPARRARRRARRRAPARDAAAHRSGLAELLTPRPFNPTTFPNDERYDELVVAEEIPVQSLCGTICSPSTAGPTGALPAVLREAVEAQWDPPLLAFSTRPRGRAHFTPYCLAARAALRDRPALAPIARVPEHPLVPARGGEATASTRALRWAELARDGR